jgi:hypothetical protein
MFGLKKFFARMINRAIAAAERPMSITVFFRLTSEQQINYIIYLVDRTVFYLGQQGRSADAEKLKDYFIPLGNPGPLINDFARSLKHVALVHQEQADSSNSGALSVEEVFGETLAKQGIVLTFDELANMGEGWSPAWSPV